MTYQDRVEQFRRVQAELERLERLPEPDNLRGIIERASFIQALTAQLCVLGSGISRDDVIDDGPDN